MAFVPSVGEVAPGGVYGDNERDLFDSEPAFDPFLTIDGRADVTEPLEVDETVKFVAGCKFRAVRSLCCQTRRYKLLVTPTYSVLERLLIM